MSKSNPKTRTIPGFSFRSRLIWNNGLLVVITLAATTFFALNRTSQTNAFLAAQGRGAIDWALPENPDAAAE